MSSELTLTLTPEIALDEAKLELFLQNKYAAKSDSFFYRIRRQSIDARKGNVKVNLQIEISSKPLSTLLSFKKDYQDVSKHQSVLIIGAGPAGLFAALRLIELGIKPIILERGKDVQARRRDIAAINKEHIVNPDSNYCFGEGGAGTYSDGKLYTRAKKRGDIKRVLEILVAHGSPEQILIDAHPHIGTNKLPKVVSELRESILTAGGEIRFNTKVTDLILSGSELKGVICESGEEINGLGVILATGHSARDIYELLYRKGVTLENKPFAMGVRIEHSQHFVDSCQYHRPERGILPAASYSLVAQTHYKGIKRGVFSFCMCPGGFIVPASTAPGELVVNGMSPSKRDSPYANSGIVVAVNEPDWKKYKDKGPLAALAFQKEVETRAWQAGLQAKDSVSNSQLVIPDSQLAPAQRINDFLKGQVSTELNETSYQPGLQSADMNEVLPANIANPLKMGIEQFNKKMKGYVSGQGQLIGTETRTSSPVRIPRSKETLEHIETKRLFPCGEGAGYAGGIVSAAMDGERCAEALVKLYV